MPEWNSRQETPCTDRTPRTKGSAPFPLIIKVMARSKIQHMSVVASVYSKKGGHDITRSQKYEDEMSAA
ncbi:hypothetical protein J7T55_015443 [Diaporthe amygdali]|uniref:uncharacterized protein n=1 Tax=Phomopsis amygdali TaxID=1214568 RepID=UPI0022FECFB2|nr:uncharacterized protein J7T55_015443 [Diaporthe amygdali]KAJ0120711.1 hypothetical protein J7T55_015443 [Diaporthe amygdali]